MLQITFVHIMQNPLIVNAKCFPAALASVMLKCGNNFTENALLKTFLAVASCLSAMLFIESIFPVNKFAVYS